MKHDKQHYRVSLSTEDLEYLCEVLQPDINKGDLGALQLWNEFQVVLSAAKENV